MLHHIAATTKLAISGKPGSRYLWGWINMIFNRVDKQRLKEVGPNRACAEWLLRNGACLRYVGSAEVLHCDYNSLPALNKTLMIKEIEGNDAGIMDIGFDHLEGCKHIDRISLEKCGHIDNNAIFKLEFVKETLKTLELVGCHNITDHGLSHLKVLSNLENLVLADLPYVKDMDKCKIELQEALKNCKITNEKK